MKILEISNYGLTGRAHTGAIESVIANLSEQFCATGHEVTILDRKSDKPIKSLPANVKFVELDIPPYDDIRARFYMEGTSRVRQEILKSDQAMIQEINKLGLINSHDVIHLHHGQLAIALGKQCGNKCVYTCNTPNHWTNLDDYKSPRGWLKLARVKQQQWGSRHDLSAFQSCGLSIVLGQHTIDTAEFLNPGISSGNVMRIIPHGIDLDFWKPIDKETARTSIGMPSGKFHVLCIARFHPEKGVHILLDAIRRLEPLLPDLCVTLIGSPTFGLNHESYTESLHRLAKDLPVKFEGFISNRDARYKFLLASADLSVVPSVKDNQPTTVMESLSMGVPVLGSKVSAIPDMLTRDVGRTFAKNDPVALSNTLLALYQNRSELVAMKARARKHAESYFDWRTAAEKNVAAFEALLASNIR